MKELENMTKPFLLYSVFALGVALGPAQAMAQVTLQPVPARAPAEPVPPAVSGLGEDYRVELQIGAWMTIPSTVMYSDTETISTISNGTTTSTLVVGTNIDFMKTLGLTNQVFPEGHITVRLAPKHKLRGEYTRMLYKQTATIGADFKFNGQTYLAGQTVDSTLRWYEWNVAYEFDPIVTDRGYLGVMGAVTSLSVAGATANTVQSGTAEVNILMPGIGATARRYVTDKLSVSGDFFWFFLPGGTTSTHGHVINAGGYATYNINKHVGAQAGYRFFDTNHVWDSPLNTGTMWIGGPFVGGTAHF
jgi:hypothetical protein